MWDAFPLQMYDFDRSVEIGLRRMLDPVVARRPPERKKRLRVAEELFVAGEPVALTIPITPSRTL